MPNAPRRPEQAKRNWRKPPSWQPLCAQAARSRTARIRSNSRWLPDLPMPRVARTLASMAIEIQPDSGGRVAVARLATDPQFTADLESIGQLDLSKPASVVLDFAGVRHINSSN